MGFIRRFTSMPGAEVLSQIEGIAIIDLPVPGSTPLVGSGTVACVGEFADMRYACKADGSGVISTYCQPVEVFSASDLLNQVGGFDETIGDFGGSGGNGFVHLRSKSYQRLILAPVNLASAQGARVFRSLPLCYSQSDTTPVVPVQGVSVPAGTEFRSGAGRVRIAKRIDFTALPVIASGISGSTSSGSAAATQTFNANTGHDWTTVARPDGTVGTYKGDILVIGNNNAGPMQPTAESGTYRVASTPTSGTAITLEKLDGSNFTFSSQSNVPWRLHSSSDADSAPVIVVGNSTPGGYGASDNGGYSVPVRPLTNSSGGNTDGTFTAGTVLTPAVAPITMTGATWDPSSGLGARLHPTTATAFTAAIQAPNAASAAGIDALYATAMAALIGGEDPLTDIDVVIAARSSGTILSQGKQHVITANATTAKGRVFIGAPPLSVQSTATATGSGTTGAGANRYESNLYTWPGVRTYIQEAVGYRIKCADGSVTTDGILDVPFDGWYASLCSILPPENSPAQSADPVPAILKSVLGIQRGVTGLTINDYTRMKSQGVSGVIIDSDTGPQVQSAVTTSLVSGKTKVNRIRFQYFCDSNLAKRLKPFKELPVSQSMKDNAFTEVDDFCQSLLGATAIENRIKGYSIDDKSGNSPALEAQDIYVIIANIKMYGTAGTIALVSRVGVGVEIQDAG